VLQPAFLVELHVVDPPGDGSVLGVHAAQDRHRDVLHAQQARQLIATDVVAVGVLEVGLRVLAGRKDCLLDVHGLNLRIVADGSIRQRHANGVGHALLGA
jgi:hypothetical protein